ncbi:hypothetical protein DFH07DRAFT_933541 [Mycena maculata]|uniref:F-box domain-containing protein n=1 Tax=Mycena maculata TaxID=230809 RepID=A0AAD7MI83_9AGAR|nr:hypothetical protein DFH07DRAFT_933541 [Mycena maculata]
MMSKSCRNCGHQDWEYLGQKCSPLDSSTGAQRAALADIKSQIIHYKTHIEALETQQQELEGSLSLVVYPVLSLPFEVTSRIFVHCLPAHGRVSPSPSNAPLILAQICRDWRDIAVSTCELWSSIYFQAFSFSLSSILSPTQTPNVPCDNGTCALLETWLARAKGHPISLGLLQQFRPVPQALVSLLSSISGQIQRLDLHLLPAQFNEFRQLHPRFPDLQYLATIHSSNEDLQGLLTDAPSLCELCLLGTDFSIDFSLPWLTHLEITQEITAQTFLDILANFPVLAHLKFDLKESDAYAIPESSIPKKSKGWMRL